MKYFLYFLNFLVCTIYFSTVLGFSHEDQFVVHHTSATLQENKGTKLLFQSFSNSLNNDLASQKSTLNEIKKQHRNDEISHMKQANTAIQQTITLHDSITNSSIANGTFENAINKTGWSYLEITTDDRYPDVLQAYAAGAVEGSLTKDLVLLHFGNTQADLCKDNPDLCNKLKKFIQKNINFMLQSIKDNPKDNYWRQIELFLCQVAGLRDALYGKVTSPDINFDVNDTPTFNTLLMQLDGDLEDLGGVLGGESYSRLLGSGSCSALIRLLDDNADVYFSHDTWSGFNTMLRIQKKYTLRLRTLSGTGIPGHTYSFSSYPGTLLSIDDFYLMSSGLATMETTLGGNNNPDLWKYVTPNTVLTWVRSTIANRLAEDGQQWVDVFSRYNSGTYNNQWMILNYNLFTPGQPLQPNTLTVLEQMPGIIVSADQTEHLQNKRYWPSYNIAFYPTIFNISHQPELVEQYGPWFSYAGSPRARIFTRDHSSVRDLQSMTRIMRYNNYQHDPLSVCECTPPYSAENAIAARSDLNPQNGTYPFPALGHRPHGATDMKLTNSTMFKSLEFLAISGPTSDQQPVFDWTTSSFKDKVKHQGQPQKFDFPAVLHHWSN